ncbi:DUF2732 domain-containing protein [Xenorhabdus bovienii]|uniref:DUF2732 family protein n=1 Tax=Xenorhabdus bovienii TaxID=40576 RepID=UPI001EDF347B|nr:DUF2732 family protein [Xenorhabdus bovienii]MCG3462041.1 DUF2732 domain-containing protein [Xenorhabdus bovienii]
MNIPEPIFLPVEINTDNHAVIMERCIKQNREDERRVRADGHASRLRYFAMMVRKDHLDSNAIAELLESEASEMERQAQEWNYV